jgi:hypothetical protein
MSVRSVRSRSLVAATVLAASAAVAVVAAPAASAATLKVAYDASGSTFVAKTNSTINLGPTTLKTKLQPSGAFTAKLNLPPAHASFQVLGLLPATATVTFIPTAKLTGQITTVNGQTTITSNASYIINLSDVTVAGVPAFVGPNCQTADPVSIGISGPFNVTQGGTLTGTYTIGNFANCGLTTGLINLLIPGPNNTVSFTLSNGRIIP